MKGIDNLNAEVENLKYAHREAAETPTVLKMVQELDKALHGQVIARPESPEEVWHSLLAEVEQLAHQRRRSS